MKKLISILTITLLLFSCGIGNNDNRINDRNLAKLRLLDAPLVSYTKNSGERYNDIVIKYIHPLYKVGDSIRINSYQYRIIEILKK